jgi:hypothetical protein
LIEGEVEGGILEEDAQFLIEDTRVLREVGTVAGGADHPPGISLTVRCLLP